MPSSWEEARANVYFGVRPRAATLVACLRDEPRLVGIELAPFTSDSDIELFLVLAIESFSVALDEGLLARWDATIDDAIGVARERLLDVNEPAWTRIAEGVYRSATARGDEAARLILGASFRESLPAVDGEPVMLVDELGRLVLVGDSDAAALARAAPCAEERFGRDIARVLVDDLRLLEVPTPGLARPFRWDGARFCASSFRAVSPASGACDADIARLRCHAFALAADHARRGGALGEPTFSDAGPFEKLDARCLAPMHRFERYTPASDYVARGVPVPDELTPIDVDVAELAANADCALFPADIEWLLLVSADEAHPPRLVRLDDVRARAPTRFRPCRIAGVDALLFRDPDAASRGVEPDARRSVFDVASISVPATWEGPFPPHGLVPTHVVPTDAAFTPDDELVRLGIHHERRAKRRMLAPFILLIAFSTVAFGYSYVRRPPSCHRELNALADEWDWLAARSHRYGDAPAVFDAFATGTRHRQLVVPESIEPFPESLSALPPELVARTHALAERSERLFERCH